MRPLAFSLRSASLALALPVLAVLAAQSAHAQFMITPTYSSTITGDSNASIIEASIQSEINIYQAAFTNNANVNITFTADENISLGQSLTYGSDISYSQYVAALTATKALGTDSKAFLGYLPTNSDNGINHSGLIHLTTADQRALGINPSANSPYDSQISLKTSLMNLSRDPTAYDSSKYDLQSVVSHEINEVLGFGSGLNNLQNGDATPTGAIGTMDLYRYSSAGVHSFNTDASSTAYFSVDGGNTNLVNFNQTAPGDFHDYKSVAGTPRVQDASGTPGSAPDLGVAELMGLRDIGYNSKSNASAAPEPSEFAGLGFAAFGVLGLIWKAKKRKIA